MASSYYNISWMGASSSSNSAVVAAKYTQKMMKLSVYLTGVDVFPTEDICTISIIPLNCELLSGKSNISMNYNAGELKKVRLIVCTPAPEYKNKEVKFSVSIQSKPGYIVKARGQVG